ncbi:hypothetical protein CMO88_04380 [Candidatus Woesearchaeota archaeon]|nr:hypothetical protein [Candidatus Woesearchaeota archaeon]|tara:strand:+ start:10816 stop:11232 length:417 start_codon:yes stop_codon:yes gene_type:complete
MSERYFLALIVVAVVFGSVWLSLVEPVVTIELTLAILLGLLGLVTIVKVNSVKVSSLMRLFFITALAYELYIYLNNPVGYILASISVLSFVGLILSFGVSPVKANTEMSVPVVAEPVEKTVAKPSKKKAAKKKKKSKK